MTLQHGTALHSSGHTAQSIRDQTLIILHSFPQLGKHRVVRRTFKNSQLQHTFSHIHTTKKLKYKTLPRFLESRPHPGVYGKGSALPSRRPQKQHVHSCILSQFKQSRQWKSNDDSADKSPLYSRSSYESQGLRNPRRTAQIILESNKGTGKFFKRSTDSFKIHSVSNTDTSFSNSAVSQKHPLTKKLAFLKSPHYLTKPNKYDLTRYLRCRTNPNGLEQPKKRPPFFPRTQKPKLLPSPPFLFTLSLKLPLLQVSPISLSFHQYERMRCVKFT